MIAEGEHLGIALQGRLFGRPCGLRYRIRIGVRGIITACRAGRTCAAPTSVSMVRMLYGSFIFVFVRWNKSVRHGIAWVCCAGL